MKISNNYVTHTFCLLVVMLTSISGCGSSNSDSPPEIISVTPTVGAAGTPVTIAGTGFSATVSENSVSFNGTASVVTTATPEELQTTVPEGAISGPMGISVNGQSAQGPFFTVDNRLNFEGDYESEGYPMNVMQIVDGTVVLDTTITVTITSEVEIALENSSMDEIVLDIEEFLEDGLNFVLTSTVLTSADEDAVAEVSGNEFELEDTDVSIMANGSSIIGELNGEGILAEDGNIIFSFEYIVMADGTQLIFSGEVELEKQ